MNKEKDSRKVLLIGIDGADWNIIQPLVDNGEMPTFKKLIESGVHGNLTTVQPTLSPMLWNTIATGKRAYKHGIHGFTEVDPITEGIRPVTSTSRKCKAVWNILQQQEKKCHLVNWFASHPAEPLNGVSISDLFTGNPPFKDDAEWTVPKGSVHPENLAETLAEFRVFPSEMDDSIVALFIERWEELEKSSDKRLFNLMIELSRAFSLQTLILWILENNAWDFVSVYFRTTDILCHHFMPYAPPHMKDISEEDFDIFNDVVNSTYRLFDLLLTRILQVAGEDATIMIVSDHGFLSGDLRPPFNANPFADPEASHRQQGIFCITGPGIKKNEEIHSARLPDITPTLLTLFNQPVGQDMDGRVLLEIFEDTPEIETIPSWEDVEGDAGMHTEDVRMDADDAEALVKQFEALGYIEPVSENKEKAIASTIRGNKWNLARECMDANQLDQALPILEELHEDYPAVRGFTFYLAQCYRRLGLPHEADVTAQEIIDVMNEGPELHFLRGNIAIDNGKFTEGLEHFKKVESADDRYQGLHLALGRTYLKLHHFDSAEKSLQRVLEIDPDSAFAYQGLAYCELRRRRYDTASTNAFRAIELQPNLPKAHFYLGLALDRLSYDELALQAFETALVYDTDFAGAHRALARLYGRKPEFKEKADEHRLYLEQSNQRAKENKNRLKALQEEIRQRAQERAKKLWQEASFDSEVIEDTSADNSDDKETFEIDKEIPFVIVSGLPRSGTSLMMQILQAAGLELMTDNKREADKSNPEGYFEWEKIKKIKNNPNIIEEAYGNATKVVSILLGSLPKQYHYKILFMDRPIEEIAASQQKMLETDGKQTQVNKSMQINLAKHKQGVIELMDNNPSIEYEKIHYVDLINNPDPIVDRVISFLGLSDNLDREKIKSVIKPELYRQRKYVG